MKHVIGYTHNGRPVYAIAGGSGTDAPPVGDQTGEGEDGNEHEGEPVAREEHEAVVTRMRAADQRAAAREADLEAANEELQTARVELAVRREAVKRKRPFADLDVALSLVRESIAVGDDGQPVEVAAALDVLAERHPYLLAEHQAGPTRTEPSLHQPSSGTTGNKRKPTGGMDRAQLERKFPALKRGRRR